MDHHIAKLMCYLCIELFWFCGKEEKIYLYTHGASQVVLVVKFYRTVQET